MYGNHNCCIIAQDEKLLRFRRRKIILLHHWAGDRLNSENNRLDLGGCLSTFSICPALQIITVMPQCVCGNTLPPLPLRDTCEQFPTSKATNHSLSAPCVSTNTKHTIREFCCLTFRMCTRGGLSYIVYTFLTGNFLSILRQVCNFQMIYFVPILHERFYIFTQASSEQRVLGI